MTKYFVIVGIAVDSISDQKNSSLKIKIVLHLYVFSDEITIRHYKYVLATKYEFRL